MNRYTTSTGIRTNCSPGEVSLVRKASKDMNVALHFSWKQGQASYPDRTNLVYLTESEIHKCHKHFMSNLVRQVYNQRLRKKGKRIPSIFFVEGGPNTDKRWHTHGAIQLPDWCMKDTETTNHYLHSVIPDCYKQTRWCYNRLLVEPIYEVKHYADYMSKDGIHRWDLSNTC